jgi:hypothetical protein
MWFSFLHQTIQPPTVSFENFHDETKLYTVMMIDPGKALYIWNTISSIG